MKTTSIMLSAGSVSQSGCRQYSRCRTAVLLFRPAEWPCNLLGRDARRPVTADLLVAAQGHLHDRCQPYRWSVPGHSGQVSHW